MLARVAAEENLRLAPVSSCILVTFVIIWYRHDGSLQLETTTSQPGEERANRNSTEFKILLNPFKIQGSKIF
jgi:hypothetical protein